jgi:hypothetical protein
MKTMMKSWRECEQKQEDFREKWRKNIFDWEKRRQTVNQSLKTGLSLPHLTHALPVMSSWSLLWEEHRRLCSTFSASSSNAVVFFVRTASRLIDRFSSFLSVSPSHLVFSIFVMSCLWDSHWRRGCLPESCLLRDSSVEIKVIKGNKVKWCWREVAEKHRRKGRKREKLIIRDWQVLLLLLLWSVKSMSKSHFCSCICFDSLSLPRDSLSCHWLWRLGDTKEDGKRHLEEESRSRKR